MRQNSSCAMQNSRCLNDTLKMVYHSTETGKLKSRTTREITEEEIKKSRDFL